VSIPGTRVWILSTQVEISSLWSRKSLSSTVCTRQTIAYNGITHNRNSDMNKSWGKDLQDLTIKLVNIQ
jgi:hypothetical protein